MDDWVGQDVDLVGHDLEFGNVLNQHFNAEENHHHPNYDDIPPANNGNGSVTAPYVLEIALCDNENGVECPAAQFWRQRCEQIILESNRQCVVANNNFMEIDRLSTRLRRAEKNVRAYQRFFDNLNLMDPIRKELDDVRNQGDSHLRPGQTDSPSSGIEVSLQASENPQRIDHQRLDILEKEVETARKELEILKMEKSALQEEKAQLHQHYLNVSKERDRFKDQCQILGQSVDANAQLSQKLQAAEEANKKLEHALEIEGKRIKLYDQKLIVLQKQNGSVKEILVATQKELHQTRENLAAATPGNELLEKDVKKFQLLKRKLPPLNQVAAELKSNLAALKTDISKAKSDLVEETKQSVNALLEKSKIFLETSNATIACLRAEVGKKTSDLESSRQKLHDLIIVRNTQQQELEKHQARINKMHTALQAKEKDLKAANDAKKAAKDDTAKKIQSILEEAKNQIMLEEAKKKQAAVQAKLDESLKSQAALQGQLSQLEEERDQMGRQLSDKKSALEAAKVSLKQLKTELAQVKNTSRTAMVIEKEEIRKLRESMEDYKRKYEAASMDLERLNNNMLVSEFQKTVNMESGRAQRALVETEKPPQSDAILQAICMEKNRCREDEVAQLRTEKERLQTDLDRSITEKQLHINLYAKAIGTAASLEQRIVFFARHEDPVVQEENKKVLGEYQSELMKALASAHNAGVNQDKKK